MKGIFQNDLKKDNALTSGRQGEDVGDQEKLRVFTEQAE